MPTASLRPARPRPQWRRPRAVAVPLVAAFALGALAVPASAATPADDREHRLVDAVPTPGLNWYDCYGGDGECASLRVPEDYDDPGGRTVELALGRLRAADPAHRIGTLLINPGGPGASAVLAALTAPDYLPPSLLRRFDVVGVDPRGQGFSDPVRCFRTGSDQQTVLAPLRPSFPLGSSEQDAAVAAAAAFGRACAQRRGGLADAASSTEAARDLDVVRRALGEPQLTFLGFSYGTYLGTLYANLFPDRVRALALDGAVDPLAWRGSDATRFVPAGDRLRAGDSAWRATREIWRRCAQAGPDRCRLAGLAEDPAAAFAAVMARLQRGPVTVADQGERLSLSYADVVGALLRDLYDPEAATLLDDVVSALWRLVRPGADPADQRAARRELAREWTDRGFRPSARGSAVAPAQSGPVDTSAEGYAAVICSDSRNPDDARTWADKAASTQARAPHFGLPWLWASAPCAESTWTARDEDVYTGPFTRATAHPVLVVGSRWDPATPLEGASRLAGLMPGARLLASDSWGHTAFGTSACATAAVVSYLVALKLPAAGTVCTGDVQPFTRDLDADSSASAARAPSGTDGTESGPGATPSAGPGEHGAPVPLVPLTR
ncbi:MAG: alpha/beta hydrolase [Kineosporiaceae bacterium]